MHSIQTVSIPFDAQKREDRIKPLLLTAILPIVICLVTLTSALLQRISHSQAATTPQFDMVIGTSTVAEARKISGGVRQYQVTHIEMVQNSHYLQCLITTQEGTHFLVLGPAVDRISQGLIFTARTLPFPTHTKKTVAWLVEYNPNAVTDPSKLTFPNGGGL